MIKTLRRSKKITILFLLMILVLVAGSITFASRQGNVKGIKGVSFKEDGAKNVLHAPWGKQDGAFGKEDEAARQGPMSFAVKDKRIYFLDQINKRVQIFTVSGKFIKAFRIEKPSYVDIKIDSGKVFLLDAYVSFCIDVYSERGELLKEFPVSKELEPVTGFEIKDGRVTAESNHAFSTVIGWYERGLRTVKKGPSFSGRPGPGNKPLKATFNRGARIEANGRTLNIEGPEAQAILDLITDGDDSYVLLAFGQIKGDQIEQPYFSLMKTGGSKAGWQLLLPDKYVTDHYRKVTVDKGRVYQMQTDEDGVRLVRWL